MAEASGSLHEPADQLRAETIDRHRAIVSLMEELEAVDWYDQRIDAAGDADLAAILTHNRDEEKEHAAMVLEWLRRHDATWDSQLRRYLFTADSITATAEAAETTDGGGTGPAESSLQIGGLRDKQGL